MINIKQLTRNFLRFIKPRPYNVIKENFKTYDPEFKVFVMYVYITEPLCQLISIVTYMVCIMTPYLMNTILEIYIYDFIIIRFEIIGIS